MREAKFNGIALGELSVNFMESPAKIHAKAAFINTQTGQTHGYTTCHQWSPDVIEKLRELRALMERDVSALHFVDAVVSSASPTTTGSGGMKEGFTGLGEKLGSADDGVPQVG